MSTIPESDLDCFPLLADLSDKARQAFLSQLEPVTFPADTTVCREGEPGDAFYLVVSGCIRIERKRTQGGQAEVHRITKGDYAGLTSLFADRPRSATLTTLEATRCLTIGREPLLALVEQYPEISKSLLGFLARRFRLARSILADHRPDSTDTRTAVAIFDSKVYDRDSFGLHLTSASACTSSKPVYSAARPAWHAAFQWCACL